MVKRSTPRKSKCKPSTSGGTPQHGDRLKLRRMKVVKNSKQNEQSPLDLEPDGNSGKISTRPTSGNQYDALSDEDDDKEEDTGSYMVYASDDEDIAVVEVASPATPPADLEPDGSVARHPGNIAFLAHADDANPFQVVTKKNKLVKPRRSKRRRNKKKSAQKLPDETLEENILKTAIEEQEDLFDVDYESESIADEELQSSIDPVTRDELLLLRSEKQSNLQTIRRALEYPPNLNGDNMTVDSQDFSHHSQTYTEVIDILDESIGTESDFLSDTSSNDSSPTAESDKKMSYKEAASGTAEEFSTRPIDLTRSI